MSSLKKGIWESMLSILSGNILHLCCQQLGRHQLFFQFPDEVRRILYTTNVIEWLIRQYWKVTKTKSVSPSDSLLEKMLYLASQNVAKKWTQRYRS